MRSALLILAVAAIPAASASAQSVVATPTGDAKTSSGPTFVVSKWQAKIYGFAEADGIYDNTQSFSEGQGGGTIAKPGTFGGENGRSQFSVRNSRIGLSIESPATESGVKATGVAEMDFLGYAGTPFAGQSEANYYTAATFRVRHMWLKLQTPVVDVQAGQTWSLFGMQPYFQPASVGIQGLVGELYQRTPQLRLSKTVATESGSKLEFAASAQRSPQRDAGLPEFDGGLRFELGGWKGYKSTGSTGGGATGLMLGVSGTLRNYKLATDSTTSAATTATGQGVAVGAVIPLIPMSDNNRAGSLTFVGEASTGKGYADSFSGTNFGAQIGAPQLAAGAPAYPTANIDPGLVGWATDTGALTAVDVKSLMTSAQYYLPVADGRVWLNGLFSVAQSDNVGSFLGKSPGLADAKLFTASLFFDVTPAARIGLEEAYTRQKFTDNTTRNNARTQASFFYIF